MKPKKRCRICDFLNEMCKLLGLEEGKHRHDPENPNRRTKIEKFCSYMIKHLELTRNKEFSHTINYQNTVTRLLFGKLHFWR